MSLHEQARDTARRAIAVNFTTLKSESTEYAVMLDKLIDFHKHIGNKKFELYYNLRKPNNKIEDWSKKVMNGVITESEYRNLVKSDALRPIDDEMLTEFHNAYDKEIFYYSKFIQNIPSFEQGKNSSWEKHEDLLDGYIRKLGRKLPLWKQNIQTVFEYIEKQRIVSGQQLIKIGDFEGTSAHWVLHLVLKRTRQAWKSCKVISRRSQSDPRYLYAATAAHLFSTTWLTKMPRPQSLREHIRHEYIFIKASIEHNTDNFTATKSTQDLDYSTEEIIDNSIDNEAREQLLIGEMFTLVGKTNHIFRLVSRADHGIDGEIEFKDNSGNASGKRVYVQLKSGNSYLYNRKSDGAEVFRITKPRHVQYWKDQNYPVMLVIRTSNGAIRWMNISAYLRQQPNALNNSPITQIVFKGEIVTPENITKLSRKLLNE